MLAVERIVEQLRTGLLPDRTAAVLRWFLFSQGWACSV